MTDHPLDPYLEADDKALEARWQQVRQWIEARFGKAPGIEEVLFLVGVQSRGQGFEPKLAKEAKQGLIMEGTCCVFETLGIYERVGMEEDGAWIWERAIEHPPDLSVEAQEKLLKTAIIRYFEAIFDPHEEEA